MSSIQAVKNVVTHLPVPASTPTVQTVSVPTVAGNANAPRTLQAPTSGPRALVLSGVTVNIDLTSHTAQNIVDKINGANIPGVTANLDRYGQLNINGVTTVAGDPLLLQHLGFN